jgi:hypothetical protein
MSAGRVAALDRRGGAVVELPVGVEVPGELQRTRAAAGGGALERHGLAGQRGRGAELEIRGQRGLRVRGAGGEGGQGQGGEQRPAGWLQMWDGEHAATVPNGRPMVIKGCPEPAP